MLVCAFLFILLDFKIVMHFGQNIEFEVLQYIINQVEGQQRYGKILWNLQKFSFFTQYSLYK